MHTAPASAHRAAAAALNGLPEHRRELFGLRLDRWWQELDDGLQAVYPKAAADTLARRLVDLAARAFAERDPDLARLDAVRTLGPDWFQSPRTIGYAAYTDRFAGDLSGLHERIPYLRELGVTYLHLMPLLQPRAGDNDGGYAVQDYRAVRADLGTVDDLRKLATALRAAGISLVLDLVLNHVAAEHAWAVAARAGDLDKRDYFHVYPDRTVPDVYERTLPEVFPDFAPGNFTWDDDLRAWVWTTFNAWQWDLNWANPQVFYEFAAIVLFLANLGVEVVRLDAIAFLWKRLGTDSQNQPEVHALTQALRSVARIACPALLFKAEAIVGPTDLVQYLGRGRHHGKVSDLAYHNSLMVQIWSMLAAGDARLAAHALRALPPIPSTTAWITYLRCHDDIGWAIDPADAAAVGVDGWRHQQYLSDYYTGQFPGSPARGLVFQFNPGTGDRRISGMAAALTGVPRNEGPGSAVASVAAASGADADSEPLDLAVRRLLLGYAVVLGWGGVPVIWMGDELALDNDADWAEDPAHAEDNRWTHRPPMDWARAAARHDPDTVAGRVYAGLRHLIETRSRLEQLHASIAADILELSDPGILPVARNHPSGLLLGLYNVADTWRPWPGWRLDGPGLRSGVDALTGKAPDWGDDDNLWLAPYSAVWLVARA
ncbi:MAG: alpha-amylase family protein [bacterium]